MTIVLLPKFLRKQSALEQGRLSAKPFAIAFFAGKFMMA